VLQIDTIFTKYVSEKLEASCCQNYAQMKLNLTKLVPATTNMLTMPPRLPLLPILQHFLQKYFWNMSESSTDQISGRTE